MLSRMRTTIAKLPECEDAIKEPLTKNETLPQNVDCKFQFLTRCEKMITTLLDSSTAQCVEH
jgi:hypothetical protein